MVSNPTGQPQRDRASLTMLGDTLARRGRLHAAHFCYLVAEVAPGSYSQKDSKLVLVGSSHSLPFQVQYCTVFIRLNFIPSLVVVPTDQQFIVVSD